MTLNRLLLAFAAASLAAAADNTLTPEERKAGWRLMFDGRSFANWEDPARKNPPGDSWVIENGCLKTVPQPRIAEDLFSRESFRDFELKFDWLLGPRGNTGVKYRIQRKVFMDSARVQKGEGGWEGTVGREIANPLSVRSELTPGGGGAEFALGFEMQLVDDAGDADSRRDGRYATGGLYSMIAPASRPARPAGEWNHGRIVVKGDRIEHWINGVKVLEGALSAPAVHDAAFKRWGRYPQVLAFFTNPRPEGPICLQHHGTEVRFRNLKLLRLK